MTIREIIEAARQEEHPDYDVLIASLLDSDEMTEARAERDSLKEENEKLITESAKNKQELAETKKLNFTLARQIDRGPQKSLEEMLNDLF